MRQQELDDASLLTTPTAREEPEKTLITSGLDAVIWFDCTSKECIRRADGRRVDAHDDSESPETYHVEDNMPQTNDAPLCERLEHIKDHSNPTSGLVDRFVSFDQTTKSLEKWLNLFGVENKGRVLLQKIDANKEANQVFTQIKEIVDLVLEH